MSKPAILDIQPGYLNDFNVDDVDQESIDFQSESPQSIVARMKDKVFAPNKFKTAGTLIGILLRDDNKYGDCTTQDTVIEGGTKNSKKYRLNTYKVRVPEIHFMLPAPNNLPAKTNYDRHAIDMHPTIQAIDTLVQTQGARPGDLVKVEMVNKGAMTKMFFAGPVDPKSAGTDVQAIKACIDDCKKTYTGQGSVGDCISTQKNVSNLDEVPPINTGEGVNEKKAIAVESPAWLKNILDPKGDNSGSDHFDGITIFGRMDSGASDDDLKMIDGAGRSTVIFIPKGVDPKQDVELIYFFHDKNKFANDTAEWREIGTTIFNMTRKKDELSGGRRNSIFVMPELVWSKQAATGDFPRTNSQNNVSLQGKYGDRQWGQWGFDGKLKKIGNKIPSSYNGKSPKGPGDIKKLIKTVYEKLKEHTGADVKKNVKFITLAAESYGGVAISNLARMDKLKEFGKQLQKIQLFHADYASTPENSYHDNDIRDIMAAIDPTQTEIEFHLSTKNRAAKPKNAVASFVGNASKWLVDWSSAGEIPSSKDAIKQMIDKYKNELSYKNAGLSLLEAYKNQHQEGIKFIEANKTKTLRLSGPWVNFIFRGVDAEVKFDWITWLPEDGKNIPTAASSANPLGSLKKVIVAGTDITKKDEKAFSEFKGTTLLYNSQYSGLKGKTAIVVPSGADLSKPYEIIYYFHGLRKGGTSPSRWRSEGFKNNIPDNLLTMVNKQKRNLVYVTTQLNVQSKMDYKKATFAESGKFDQFHAEVVDKIKETDPAKGLGGTAEPKFINIKSFSGGYYSLRGLVETLQGPTIGGTELQRIDYLDSTYSYISVFEKTLVTMKNNFKPGENFEIHVYGSTTGKDGTWDQVKKFQTNPNEKCKGGFNGCKKIMDGGKEAKLSSLEGLFLEKVSGGHYGPLKKRFARESLLSPDVANATPNFVPKKAAAAQDKVLPKDLPVSYDEEGKAYNHKGQVLPDKYDLQDPGLKCAKGNKEKQRANTVHKAELNKCKVECRKRFTGKGAKKASREISPGIPECGSNPLGLIDYGKGTDFNKNLKITEVMPRKKWHGWKKTGQYTWGKPIVGNFIKQVLENEIWSKTKEPSENGSSWKAIGGKFVQWFVADISPQWANDIDKVWGHASHRGGFDLDTNIPIDFDRSPKGTVNVYKRVHDHDGKRGKKLAVDYDKVIAFGILTIRFNSRSRVFFGSTSNNFYPNMKKRMDEIGRIVNGETGEKFLGAYDGAFDTLFKSYFRGSLDDRKAAKKRLVGGLFLPEKNHNNHFHIRLGQTFNNSIKKANRRLKKNKCTWKKPNQYSDPKWKKYAEGFSSEGKLPESKKGWKGM